MLLMSEQLTPKQTQELDLSTDEWTERLANAPVYAKKGIVQARQVAEREDVRTTLANGTEETVNVAEPGDVVVTNPGGERYVLKPDNFAKRYETTEEEGVFRARGMARAVENPTGTDIEIIAPWGEKQFGGADCLVATVFDPEQPDVIGSDRYIIGRQEFNATYAPYAEVYSAPTQPQPTPEQ
jgi:hypothetical protein